MRRAIFGPSSGGLYGPQVARIAAKQQTGVARLAATLPHMARLWPTYLMRHWPFLARHLFSNEKACRRMDAVVKTEHSLVTKIRQEEEIPRRPSNIGNRPNMEKENMLAL